MIYKSVLIIPELCFRDAIPRLERFFFSAENNGAEGTFLPEIPPRKVE
jgi:hypothetical protein